MHPPNNNKSPDPLLETLMTDMVSERHEALRRERRRLIIHRAASAIIALCYLLLALYTGGGHFFVRTLLFLILPMAAIWFPDELGSLTGVRFGRLAGPVITSPSPGSLVRCIGWIVLLLPLAAVIFML